MKSNKDKSRAKNWKKKKRLFPFSQTISNKIVGMLLPPAPNSATAIVAPPVDHFCDKMERMTENPKKVGKHGGGGVMHLHPDISSHFSLQAE